MLTRHSCAFMVLAVLAACMSLPQVEAGAYVPFDPKLWVLPPGFKIQKYYSGESLGLATEYGNLVSSLRCTAARRLTPIPPA
jgi:hypothetical protein